MVRITEELLRKRSEHNEGCLGDLEEIALHQFEIERIELVGERCRRLRILLLQNNLISRIENLHKLKELEYLNLALNNVTRVEGLGACESLVRLDLTANYISDLTSVCSLAGNHALRELHLVGNPCTQIEGYRLYIVHALPQLESLDGERVTKSERIEAEQLAGQLGSSVPAACAKLAAEPGVAFTPEERVRVYREMAEKREAMERDRQPPPVPQRVPAPARVKEDGTVMQMNQGDWHFALDDAAETVSLDVALPRFLDTSLIEVDPHPKYVRIVAKGKVLQLNFPVEVRPDAGTAQRSQTTGHLVLTFPKVNPGKAEIPVRAALELNSKVTEMGVLLTARGQEMNNRLADVDVRLARMVTEAEKRAIEREQVVQRELRELLSQAEASAKAEIASSATLLRDEIETRENKMRLEVSKLSRSVNPIRHGVVRTAVIEKYGQHYSRRVVVKCLRDLAVLAVVPDVLRLSGAQKESPEDVQKAEAIIENACFDRLDEFADDFVAELCGRKGLFQPEACKEPPARKAPEDQEWNARITDFSSAVADDLSKREWGHRALKVLRALEDLADDEARANLFQRHNSLAVVLASWQSLAQDKRARLAIGDRLIDANKATNQIELFQVSLEFDVSGQSILLLPPNEVGDNYSGCAVCYETGVVQESEDDVSLRLHHNLSALAWAADCLYPGIVTTLVGRLFVLAEKHQQQHAQQPRPEQYNHSDVFPSRTISIVLHQIN
eukprot:m51a1_g6617 hypothetical protein (729) ;mRNA; f:38356-41207